MHSLLLSALIECNGYCVCHRAPLQNEERADAIITEQGRQMIAASEEFNVKLARARAELDLCRQVGLPVHLFWLLPGLP